MHVWLLEMQSGQPVDAQLEPLTDLHVQRANATWVPEFQRRRDLRLKDEDNLVWDWPSKEKYLLGKDLSQAYVVSRARSVEGILVLRGTERSRLAPGTRVVYVRYLATAPWNRPRGSQAGRHRRTGTVLLAHAVRESLAAGCSGRLGLHSLSGSNSFYRKLNFQDLGSDAACRGMTYFELAPGNALQLLSCEDETMPTSKAQWLGQAAGQVERVPAERTITSHQGGFMKTDDQPIEQMGDRGTTSFAVLVARLTWFIAGPAALCFSTYAIVTGGKGWLTPLNVFYFAVLGVMVWGRWVEQRSGSAMTVYGKPATWEDFRHYVRVLFPVGTVIWLVANIVGNHLLKSVE